MLDVGTSRTLQRLSLRRIRKLLGDWKHPSFGFVFRVGTGPVLGPGPRNSPRDLYGVSNLERDRAESCRGKVDPVGRVVSSLVNQTTLSHGCRCCGISEGLDDG